MDVSWKLQCVYTDFLIPGGHPSTWHCTFSKTVTKSALIDLPNTTTITQTIYQLTGPKNVPNTELEDQGAKCC